MNTPTEERQSAYGRTLEQRRKTLAKHRVMAELENDEMQRPYSLTIGQMYRKYASTIDAIVSIDVPLLASSIEMMRQDLRRIRNMDFQEVFLLIFGVPGAEPFVIRGLTDDLSFRGSRLRIGKMDFLHYLHKACIHWEKARWERPLLLHHEMAVVYYLGLLLRAVDLQGVPWDVGSIEQTIKARVYAVRAPHIFQFQYEIWPRLPRNTDNPLWI